MKLGSNHLYICSFGQHWISLLEKHQGVLSQNEVNKAEKYIFAGDKKRYKASHIALRLVLSQFLHCEPREIAFFNGENGKPFLSDRGSQCFFSLSRTKNHIAIAVTSGSEVGIDIESYPSIRHWKSIAKQYFSDEEFDAISGLEKKRGLRLFLECWTKREALLKAVGDGITNLNHWKASSFLDNSITDPRTNKKWDLIPLTSCDSFVMAAACEKNRNEKEIIVRNIGEFA